MKIQEDRSCCSVGWKHRVGNIGSIKSECRGADPPAYSQIETDMGSNEEIHALATVGSVQQTREYLSPKQDVIIECYAYSPRMGRNIRAGYEGGS